jgi:non-heme chloroperoxidase
MKKGIVADRPAFLTTFLANFYNTDVFMGLKVSEEAFRLSWNIGAMASPKGTLDCVSAFSTDFREDLKRIDIPTLVVHGDADRVLPFSSSGKRIPEFVKGSRLAVIAGAPHGLNWTHAEEVNRELVEFLK